MGDMSRAKMFLRRIAQGGQGQCKLSRQVERYLKTCFEFVSYSAGTEETDFVSAKEAKAKIPQVSS